MGYTLEELHTKMAKEIKRLGNVEDELLTMREDAAKLIAKIESQEALVESTRKKIRKIEDDVLSRSEL